jgi:hypothetical protein
MIVIVAVFIVSIGIGSYYAYGAYKDNKTKEYMILALKENNTAAGLNETIVKQAKTKDYDGLIATINQSIDMMKLVIDYNNNATKYADGVYKDYITYDTMNKQMGIKYYEIWIKWLEEDRKRTTTLADATNYKKTMDEYNSKALDYKNKKDEIKTANPDKFKFLEQ